jgi:hypothetical protein
LEKEASEMLVEKKFFASTETSKKLFSVGDWFLFLPDLVVGQSLLEERESRR